MSDSKPSTCPPRSRVAVRYQEILKERESNPDRITYGGEDLKDLDAALVVLSTEAGESPRSWTAEKKWIVTVMVGLYCFLAPFTSTIFAPSLPAMMADVGETNPIRGALQVAVFLLAFAVAPIFLAPLSEFFGRTIVLRTGNVVFCAFCIGAGFSQTTAQLAVCRFFSGAGGSASLAVLGGVLTDIWDLRTRAKASAAIGTAVMLGPILGPVCGGWMSERASWRWTCWVPAIVSIVLEVGAQFTLKESHVPILLSRRLAKEQNQRPDDQLYTVLTLNSEEPDRHPATSLIGSAIRPVMYLILDPALMLLSLYYAFVFGVLYLVIVTFHIVLGDGYGHSEGIIGVDLLSVGVGALIGMLVTAKVLDIIYKRQVQGDYKPESRLLSAFPGALLVAVGLFIYGFSALKTHFIVPLLGMAIFSIGVTNTYLAIQLYIIDSFDFPASALAGLSVLRCLFAGVFPLFGDQLFDTLGIGWGVGMLAFLSIGLGLPFLPIMYAHGLRLRNIGKRNRQRFGWAM
ncbi:MFS general substrate transporter [Eremomyces bilateralis CBS 781.70]|uniref:MFS general substrate transporter n=1 Tax=Eremomyces bilateralis CBS 781.70 TaxID=1392243 RepID=A0A6G1FTW5_9PEZI|nr:MFS general substrate transporter [Eremomyces bilateralis CBS 781.70]KAF1809111.1 MFS general substrate transporter [Eremomyces bilateralis CBS 781.70]